MLIVHIIPDHRSVTDVYEGAVTLASTWISGEATNDEVKIISSPNLHHHHDMPVHQQAGRGTNVCGTDCKFNHDFFEFKS